MKPPSDAVLGYDESWLSSLLRPLLIFVLVLCINIALLVLLEQYAAGLGAGVRWAILALGVVAAVIGVTSTTWLAHPNQRLRRTAGYRIAEIVLILLVSRLVLWLAQGSLPSLDAFMLRPDEVFLDGPYLLTLLVLLFTWFAAIDFTDDLAQLALQPDELHVAQTARQRRLRQQPPCARGSARHSAAHRRPLGRLGHCPDLHCFGPAHGGNPRTLLDPGAPGRASAGDCRHRHLFLMWAAAAEPGTAGRAARTLDDRRSAHKRQHLAQLADLHGSRPARYGALLPCFCRWETRC